MTLPVDDQISRMAERWPGFRVTARFNDVVTWRGAVRPLAHSYDLRIVYGPRYFPKSGRYQLRNRIPRVEITSPKIFLRHPDTEELVPHVYEFPIGGKPPKLCLYDPLLRDWSPKMSIADTLVPWACEWIACYEGWLVTGKWQGGGRHPQDPAPDIQAPLKETRAVPSPQSIAFVVDLIGTYGSRVLLEHGIEQTADPFAIPDWWTGRARERPSLRNFLEAEDCGRAIINRSIN